ncbi:MAG: hypothetical protein QNK37_29465 [Acidobacteriota bacterium]|nr:hypothetical protein [Acidobacteriota bacterium]
MISKDKYYAAGDNQCKGPAMGARTDGHDKPDDDGPKLGMTEEVD